jgi:hypothetical protein
MGLSVLISKIVSFFASDTHYGHGGTENGQVWAAGFY